MRDFFNRVARSVSNAMGSPLAFVLALLVIVIWAATGPAAHYSETWQLVINTGTTIVTFLMVFLIQNSQNRDTKAIHLKLDELIRALHGARNRFVDLENLTDEELNKLARQFAKLDGVSNREDQRAEQEANRQTSPSESARPSGPG